jgi:hypothetical protein
MWNSIPALLIFVAWYYPIGLQHNTFEADQISEREGLLFLYIPSFLSCTETFTSRVMAVVGPVDAAGNTTHLLHSIFLISCVYVQVDGPGF